METSSLTSIANRNRSTALFTAIAGMILVLLFSLVCWFQIYKKPPRRPLLEAILKKGEMTVLTRNNAHCYYTYKDQSMGFEYELVKAFAEYLGVRLKIVIAEKWNNMIPDLINGKAALIAASLTVTPSRMEQVAFSDGYMQIQQHLIVHRTNNRVKTVEDLTGTTVHIRKGTSYQERLEQLKKEGIPFSIKLYDNMPTEELIQKVAERKIDITVADSHIAYLNRQYFPNILLSEAISQKQTIAWAFNPEDVKLIEYANAFLLLFRKSGRLEELYNKYYADAQFLSYFDLRTFHWKLNAVLPKYEPMIKKGAAAKGFDWRLIAAQMYQESLFNPRAVSRAGALGLMQIIPPTAELLKIKDVFDPVENIWGGIRHLKRLHNRFENIDEPDRTYFSLAAYNSGLGHVFDAQKLAEKINLDPYKWNSLTKTLPLLQYYRYYKNTKHGYCRGTEPVNYVRQILIYYDILKRRDIRYPRENKPISQLTGGYDAIPTKGL
jgi:membrane-bound lytic murein transglycosylase F